MRDLLVITPSRGRPARLKTMLDATLSLAQAQTDVAVALDDDDPELDAYRDLDVDWGSRVLWHTGPRRSMAGWTNDLALASVGDYGALASFGDDHVPRTEGWDKRLLDAITAMGGTGIAYGADGLMETLPTAPVISSDIVAALGWMCMPELGHYCVDNVWGDLGRGAGCLARCPDVLVEHMHCTAGKAPSDATYDEAGGYRPGCPDHLAYERWQAEHMAADVATVKGLLP